MFWSIKVMEMVMFWSIKSNGNGHVLVKFKLKKMVKFGLNN